MTTKAATTKAATTKAATTKAATTKAATTKAATTKAATTKAATNKTSSGTLTGVVSVGSGAKTKTKDTRDTQSGTLNVAVEPRKTKKDTKTTVAKVTGSSVVRQAEQAVTKALAKTDTKAVASVSSNTPREYPFIEFEPDFPSWECELASLETNFVLLSKNAQSVNPYQDNKIPTLFFAANVLSEIMYIVKRQASITGECGGYFMMKRINDQYPHFLVYDHFLVGQEAVRSEVDLCGMDSAKYFEWLLKNYPEQMGDNVHNVVGHWHSHHTMGAFWSGTDKTQQETVGQLGYQGNYRFYVVFTSDGGYKVSFLQYQPFFHRIDDVNFGLYFGDGYSAKMDRETRQELDKWCDVLIKKPAPRYYGSSYQGGYGAAAGRHYNGLYGNGYDDDIYGGFGSSLNTGTKAKSNVNKPKGFASAVNAKNKGGSTILGKDGKPLDYKSTPPSEKIPKINDIGRLMLGLFESEVKQQWLITEYSSQIDKDFRVLGMAINLSDRLSRMVARYANNKFEKKVVRERCDIFCLRMEEMLDGFEKLSRGELPLVNKDVEEFMTFIASAFNASADTELSDVLPRGFDLSKAVFE